MANNLDLQVAAARVQVASEYVKLADSTLWPQVNLLARGGGDMGGDSSGLNGVGLFADWELDLWGRVRSERAATVAGYESVVADTEYARQSVAALVAKSYFLAVEATLQLRLAEDTVATSQQLVTFAEQRQRIGKGDGYDTAIGARAISSPSATRSRSSGCRRARHCGHSRCWSAAIRPRTSRSQRNSRSRRGPCPPACRPTCWNGDRTSSPPTGASRLRSTASRKPRRPGCPASR